MINVGDILSTHRGVQYCGGYHEYRWGGGGGFQYHGHIMIHVGDIMCRVGGHHDTCRGYHEYCEGCSVPDCNRLKQLLLCLNDPIWYLLHQYA